jgi:REP element-mobilizing transposase RayT
VTPEQEQREGVTPGARLCEPQPVRIFQDTSIDFARVLSAKLLRVADPRSVGLRIRQYFVSIFDMSQPLKPRHPGPPHNPGVRELVEGKRRWSSPLKPENAKQGFRGWNERGYLPHRDELGLTQFVTFRLAESFPESLRSEWEHFFKIEDDRERREKLEAYLDKGRGECHLRRADVAQLVEDNFRRFFGDRYDLRAWVVMPNHIHVLFKVGTVSVSEIVGAWKKHTGRLANQLLGKQGAFWAEDYFDVFMRDAEHMRQTVRYIENNPTKVKLVLDPKDWPWSSARFRVAFGELRF